MPVRHGCRGQAAPVQRSRSIDVTSARTCTPVLRPDSPADGILAEENDTTVVRQSPDTLEDIFCRLQRGELSRRAFVRRATGLGIGGAAAALLARAALAETTIPIGDALASGQADLQANPAPGTNRIEAPRRHNRLGRTIEPASPDRTDTNPAAPPTSESPKP